MALREVLKFSVALRELALKPISQTIPEKQSAPASYRKIIEVKEYFPQVPVYHLLEGSPHILF